VYYFQGSHLLRGTLFRGIFSAMPHSSHNKHMPGTANQEYTARGIVVFKARKAYEVV
jgi:hypothetical protein